MLHSVAFQGWRAFSNTPSQGVALGWYMAAPFPAHPFSGPLKRLSKNSLGGVCLLTSLGRQVKLPAAPSGSVRRGLDLERLPADLFATAETKQAHCHWEMSGRLRDHLLRSRSPLFSCQRKIFHVG
jgi:hypothetical protein